MSDCRGRGTILAMALALGLAALGGAQETRQQQVRGREVEIERYLVERLGGDASTIRVILVGTRAVLTGTVQERVTQELAKEVVLSLDDVLSAANRIEARYDPTLFEGQALLEGKDAELEVRVKRALLREAGDGTARALEVEAVDGVVCLRGVVADAEHRELALRTASATPGVLRVLDLVRVAS